MFLLYPVGFNGFLVGINFALQPLVSRYLQLFGASLLVLFSISSRTKANEAAKITTLSVLAVVDSRIVNLYGKHWASHLKDEIALVSSVYEREIGMQIFLTDSFESNENPIIFTNTNLLEVTKEFRRQSSKYLNDHNCDIVLFVVGGHFAPGGSINSLALPFGREIIVRSSNSFVSTLVHEIGHIFGAVHVKDSTSVMCQNEGGFPCLKSGEKSGELKFDENNRKIINLIRGVLDFSEGVDSLDDQTIEEYDRLVSKTGTEQVNHIAITYLLGAMDAAKQNDSSSEEKSLNRALEASPNNSNVRKHVSKLYRELGDRSRSMDEKARFYDASIKAKQGITNE